MTGDLRSADNAATLDCEQGMQKLPLATGLHSSGWGPKRSEAEFLKLLACSGYNGRLTWLAVRGWNGPDERVASLA
jgi:hypothetical protein